ncbi:hypothetical protein L9F63_017484, partial [Diploptera punctata]
IYSSQNLAMADVQHPGPDIKELPTVFQDVSIQTSMEFEGTPRFSLPYVPYVPPYPIGMVSIFETEVVESKEPNLFEQVKSAYVRKYQQPDDFAEEELDLSEDVNYKLNTEPFMFSREQESEPVKQPEIEDQKISTPEELSSYTSSKSEIGETISKYQVLEKNIYGVDTAAPLPGKYDETFEATVRELNRDSERSIFEVIEDCNRVNIQRSYFLAWKQFGYEIISWAISKAFEEIPIIKEKIVKEVIVESVEDVFRGIDIASYAVENVLEKVFTKIAERGNLDKQELDVMKNKTASNIEACFEIMEEVVIKENSEEIDNNSVSIVREAIEEAIEKCFHIKNKN